MCGSTSRDPGVRADDGRCSDHPRRGDPGHRTLWGELPGSWQWPAVWSDLLHKERPNVVMIMAGRWEDSNQVIDGRVMHIGEPAYDTLLESDLQQAVQVTTSTGAYVMLLTAACIDSGEQPNGQPWPEDSPPDASPTTRC